MKNITNGTTDLYEVTLQNSNTGEFNILGVYDSINDLSHELPISTNGLDRVLMEVDDPESWEVVIYRLTPQGRRQEIPDPRIFLEDLDLIL